MSDANVETSYLPDRARGLLQIPAVRQGLLLAGIAASIALGISTVIWSRSADYSLLYANLADRDAGAIVNALQAAAIPYELEKSSGAIMVPEEHVHEARLKLAADGLPQGGGLGFELIGEDQGFGVSQFMENARYQHMLETELVRTIASLRPVRSARVHLAMPKQSVFVRDHRPASASVMIELYPGRRLENPQVAAIVHLVASSIPDLETGKITVIDQTGRLLTDANESAELALTGRQFAYKTRVEETLGQRIEALVMPLIGAGRVRAQVTADMNFTVTEQTLETFNPDTAALRSEQTSSQTQSADTATATGVPGALSNQPPAEEPATDGNDTRSQNSTATRNFELDRTISHVRQPIGTVVKLSVAVIVDERQAVASDGAVTSTPLADEEMQSITTLVKEAVGFDTNRGDTINVINAPFVAEETVATEPEAWWQAPLVRQGVRQVAGLVLVLGVIFGLLRPTAKHLLAPPPAPVLALPAAELDADGRPVRLPALTYDERLKAARSLVGEDPKRAARVVKDWVAEDV